MPELRLALLALGIVLVIAVYLYTRWQADGKQQGGEGGATGRSKRRLSEEDLPSVPVPPSDQSDEVDEEALPRVSAAGRRRWSQTGTVEESGAGVDPEVEVPAQPDLEVDSEPPEPVGQESENVGQPDDTGPEGAELAGFDPDSQKIISLHVSAAGEAGLDGAGLRRLLESAGLRHGQYDIFHRTVTDDDGRPSLLFSVASMVEPGHFDPAEMDRSEYRGVTFFAVLPGALPGIQTFHEMLGVAHRIAEDLDGEVRDEARNPFSVQRATHIEEEITEFERRRSAARGHRSH